MSSNLTDFLLARIADDAAMAWRAQSKNGGTWTTVNLINGLGIEGTQAEGNPRGLGGDLGLWDDEGALGMWGETAHHIVRNDPARVLAECEAKRLIVALHRGEPYPNADDELVDTECTSFGAHLRRPNDCATLRCLAAPFADHPDFDPSWRLDLPNGEHR